MYCNVILIKFDVAIMIFYVAKMFCNIENVDKHVENCVDNVEKCVYKVKNALRKVKSFFFRLGKGSLHFTKMQSIIDDMKKRLPFSVLLLVFALFSCRSEKTDEAQRSAIIGFSQIGSESSWRTCNTASIISSAEREGFQVVFDDAEQKQEKQIRAIRSFIVYQVDIILLAPIVEEGWDGVLSEAKEAGIPVIVVDRKIKTRAKNLFEGYIGEDSCSEGKKAAEFLLKKYADTDEHKNILEIAGTTNSSSAKGRAKAFRDTLSENAPQKFSVIYSESGDFLRSRGQEIISQIIAYNGGELKIGAKKVDVIFSHNDAMTLGILDALDSYGIKAGKDVAIVSVDGEQNAVNELKKGRLNCVVECNPKTGDALIELVKKVLSGEKIPEESYVDEDIFTEDDNLSLLEPRGY